MAIRFDVTIVSNESSCNVKPDWSEYKDQSVKMLYTMGARTILASNISGCFVQKRLEYKCTAVELGRTLFSEKKGCNKSIIFRFDE